LQKKSSEASNTSPRGEDSSQQSAHNEDSEDKSMPKKNSQLGSMSSIHIQSLIANAVMAQFGEGACMTNLDIKPYTKRTNVFCMLMATNPQN